MPVWPTNDDNLLYM